MTGIVAVAQTTDSDNTYFVDITSADSITQYGQDVMSQIRDVIIRVASSIESKPDNEKYLRDLNEVLSQIDATEIQNFAIEDPEQNSWKKFWGNVIKNKDKIFNKYKGIASDLDSMYAGVLHYQNNLKVNNRLLTDYAIEMNALREQLLVYVSEGAKIIDTMPTDTKERAELRNLMIGQVQDMEYVAMSALTSIETIKLTKGTNYNVYKQLLSVYNSTVPVLQMHLNLFKIAKEHGQIMGQIGAMNHQRNKLIEITATQSVSLAKQSVEMIGHNAVDFQLLQSAINIVQTGMVEVAQLEAARAETVKQLMLGEANVNG